MADEKMRIRLVFEDKRILSKYQKKQCLKRSWVVLNPNRHQTISEFSYHIVCTFSLFEACPYGISLFMDGFILPQFVSTSVLKDKDTVCVKKKKNIKSLLEIIEAHESETEEDDVEENAEEKKTSKKRKASSKSLTSKQKKKCKLATSEETHKEEENTVVTPSRSARRKEAKRLRLREKSKLEKEELQQKPDEHGDGDMDEVRPEPLAGSDQASPETEPLADYILWNYIEKKIWSTEKTEPAKVETIEKPYKITFEQLQPYRGSIHEGYVIAYRLMELTSSLTPGVSSFRVGKISYYDPATEKVILTPVEEFPIDKKIEEDGEDNSLMKPDETSLYKEDGSLEIEFASLLDVRRIRYVGF